MARMYTSVFPLPVTPCNRQGEKTPEEIPFRICPRAISCSGLSRTGLIGPADHRRGSGRPQRFRLAETDEAFSLQGLQYRQGGVHLGQVGHAGFAPPGPDGRKGQTLAIR